MPWAIGNVMAIGNAMAIIDTSCAIGNGIGHETPHGTGHATGNRTRTSDLPMKGVPPDLPLKRGKR